VLDAFFFRMLLAALPGWLDQRQQEAVAYLIEENRVLRRHVPGRLRLGDEERRRLAVHGYRLGRRPYCPTTQPMPEAPRFRGV